MKLPIFIKCVASCVVITVFKKNLNELCAVKYIKLSTEKAQFCACFYIENRSLC